MDMRFIVSCHNYLRSKTDWSYSLSVVGEYNQFGFFNNIPNALI